MNKLIAVTASTIALATALTSSAEAGHHFRIGLVLSALHHAHLDHHRFERHRRVIVRREVVPVYVKRRAHTPVVVTEDATPAPETTAENENSSISTAALDPATTPAADATATTETPAAADTTAETTPETPAEADTAAETPAATDTTAAETPAEPDTTPVNDANADNTNVPAADKAAPVKTPGSNNHAHPKKVADANSTDCKAFFPAVGITISVPCQK